LNLTGAALLGVPRSQLINRRLQTFVAASSRADFLAFLKKVFGGVGKHICETPILREGGTLFWANFHGSTAISTGTPQKWCRVAISDITALKMSEDAQRRLQALAAVNLELRQEIERRKAVEECLKKSEQHQTQLLEQSHSMQEQLRRLSRQVLQAQEDERKRISRELHDVIAQTLTGINVRLATLKKEASISPKGLERSIASTQLLVEESVNIVHQFARELRPAVLDDLGLIPALHSFVKSFATRTGLRARITAFAGVEQMDAARRTVFFRVAQEALANVARHAKASRVEVNIQQFQSAARMEIKDNGRSFLVEGGARAKGSERLGLLGMRERVEMVGGTFCVESAPGQGTTVRVDIPFNHDQKDNLKKPATPQ
jgi:signal transduction histidine kinase